MGFYNYFQIPMFMQIKGTLIYVQVHLNSNTRILFSFALKPRHDFLKSDNHVLLHITPNWLFRSPGRLSDPYEGALHTKSRPSRKFTQGDGYSKFPHAPFLQRRCKGLFPSSLYAFCKNFLLISHLSLGTASLLSACEFDPVLSQRARVK